MITAIAGQLWQLLVQLFESSDIVRCDVCGQVKGVTRLVYIFIVYWIIGEYLVHID